MYKRKFTFVFAITLLIIGFVAFVLFGKGSVAGEIRNGISQSLDEDFKIKESLGQIFFLNNENDSVAASSDIMASSMVIPAKGEYVFCDELGENKIKIYANKYSNVVACRDCVVENVENNSVSLRLSDGKLAVYNGVGSLRKQNDSIKQGDTVGYAKDTVEVLLYENCIILNAQDYFC